MKINTKKVITAIIVLLIIIAGAVWFFVLREGGTNDEPGNTGTALFPFGEILQGVGIGDSNTQGTTGSDSQTGQETQGEDVQKELVPQLVLISDEPTGGMTPLVKIEKSEIQSQTVNEGGEVEVVTEEIEIENHFIRYATIENGNVYETSLTGENPFFEELLVENYIPNSEKITFSKTGNSASFQYWNSDARVIETYLGKIDPIVILPEICPFDFSGSIAFEDESEGVYEMHVFLNRDVQTQVSKLGANTPGNESTYANEDTITAIKKFQALYDLEADGSLGPATKEEMKRVCAEQQEDLAAKALSELETRYSMSGFFLPQDIVSINMSPQGNDIFYLQEISGVVQGVLQSINDQAIETIFESPFTQWTSVWNKDDRIEVTTKPSYASPGYSYELNTENGDFHKSFKQRNGLTVIPDHQGERMLVHHVDVGRPKISIYEREANRFLPISIETFTDKCVWSEGDEYIYCAVPDALAYGDEYPDIWYQGLETYNDSLWRINTSTLQEELLTDLLNEHGQSIDIEEISVDSTNQYLYFLDKNTEFLWSYRIDEV